MRSIAVIELADVHVAHLDIVDASNVDPMQTPVHPWHSAADEKWDELLGSLRNGRDLGGFRDPLHACAALLVKAAKTQALGDGNKRLAVAALEAMLLYNGYRLTGAAAAVESIVMDAAESDAGAHDETVDNTAQRLPSVVTQFA